jgi:acetyl-CoA carboxylase biotin carboxyl carrier protein
VSLSAADVAEIMRLVEQSTFDELTLEIDGVKLTLRRGAAMAAAEALNRRAAQNSEGVQGAGAAQAAAGGMVNSAAGGATGGSQGSATGLQRTTTRNEVGASPAALAGVAHGNAPNSAATRANASHGSAVDANTHEVQSPLLGTFYRSPKPGAPPFIDVGSVVDEDTTVAIIEVMKLMNTVRAGVRGTVTEVLASDGSLVEFEQPLIRVRKAG